MNKVGKNTLFVKSPPKAEQQGSATAFEIKAKSGKTYTVTNAHVCGLADANQQILIDDPRSGRMVPIRILEVYPENDLCILEGLANYQGLELGTAPHINQTVYALGYPMGESLNVSTGRIKAFDMVQIAQYDVNPSECIRPHQKIEETTGWTEGICIETYQSISTDLSIYPGNSGSALIDVWGNVVGVIFASNNTTHWGHAVIYQDLQKLLEAY